MCRILKGRVQLSRGLNIPLRIPKKGNLTANGLPPGPPPPTHACSVHKTLLHKGK